MFIAPCAACDRTGYRLSVHFGFVTLIVLTLFCWVEASWAGHPQPGYDHLYPAGEFKHSQIELLYPEGAYEIVSKFGDKWDRLPVRDIRRRFAHTGIDIRAPEGTPVFASAPGVIVATYWRVEGGNTIWLRTSLREEEISLYYLHLSRVSVENGDRVAAGEIIGFVGATMEGHEGANPHLHFEVTRDDGWYDPAVFLRDIDGFVECVQSNGDYNGRPWESAELKHPWLLYPVACK